MSLHVQDSEWSSHQSLISPRLGASPDGVVQCECCGNGVLEIKCPYMYNAREHSISRIDFLETTPQGIVKAVTSIFLSDPSSHWYMCSYIC